MLEGLQRIREEVVLLELKFDFPHTPTFMRLQEKQFRLRYLHCIFRFRPSSCFNLVQTLYLTQMLTKKRFSLIPTQSKFKQKRCDLATFHLRCGF